MSNIFTIQNEIFMQFVEDMRKTIKRYEKFPAEQRFLMLTDKLILSITFMKMAMNMSSSDEIKLINDQAELTDEQKSERTLGVLSKCEKVSGIFDLIKNEFEALEGFIQSDSKSILDKMENKLDEVLLGPYYTAGLELMKNAENHFNENKTENK